jgi:hypothetical protein
MSDELNDFGAPLEDWIPERDHDGEWKQYPLYVFDIRRHIKDMILWRPDKSLEELEQMVWQLRQKEDRTNPYFRRLGKVLARRLPDSEFWRNDPAGELATCTSAVWQPKLKDPGRIRELLPVLLPLARRLELYVFDAFQRICLPGQDETFIQGNALSILEPRPLGRGLAFRRTYDPEASQEQARFTETSYSGLFEERLTAALGKHGFKKETRSSSYSFMRRHGAGSAYSKQEIEAEASKRHLDCQIWLRVFSERMRDIRARWSEKGFNYGSRCGDFSMLNMWNMRIITQPDWVDPAKRFHEWRSPSIITQEEANWLIEDLLLYGIPLLDRAWTVEGMDWLYNKNPAIARYFDVGYFISASSGYFSRACLATIYARLAGNSDFDNIVRDFGQNIEMLPDYDDMFDLRIPRQRSMRKTCRYDDDGNSTATASVCIVEADGRKLFVDTKAYSNGRISHSCYRRDSSGNTVPESFPPNRFSEKYAMLVDLCRTDLGPVDGNEPA